MADNQKKPNENMNSALNANNDQLGENASMEFAKDYDNKENTQKNMDKSK